MDVPDLYLVEELNQVRWREEFAVKKKTFTTKDARGTKGKLLRRLSQRRRDESTAMVQHEEPIRSS